ncbi:hypothetical protein OPT61_g7659 [Boeremia exigua]|uniref:Uncharacterized protein n=1 Tax=Boeremia exigua TaxID=749465 RepID=A0ACC2I2G1_9PLEO|nr:hypothetical protein OPT61_g7659 [Boeremia exigua]
MAHRGRNQRARTEEVKVGAIVHQGFIDELPNEIIHQILREYQGETFTCVLPLVCINRRWQAVAESYLWQYLRIRPRQIGCFRAAFIENPRRRRALRSLDIRFEYYFAQEYRPRQEPASSDNGDSDEDSSNENDNDPCKVCPRGQCTKDKNPFVDEGHVQEKSGENIWKEDLQMIDIQFYMYGRSIYDSFGQEICEGGSFDSKALLEFPEAAMLPSLTSVKLLRAREETNYEIDLWPATVACNITSSLPMLECLDIMGVDNWRLWPLARKILRHSFADQIAMLPASLKTLHLHLEYCGIENHTVQPPSLLLHGQDHLSQSLRSVSTHLTTLALRLGEISTSLFWVPEQAPTDACGAIWPNLRVLDISTGLERASGDYWLRPAADYPEHERYDWGRIEDERDYPGDEHTRRLIVTGGWPPRRFLTRPEPAFFDELANSIAYADCGSPRGFQNYFHQYEGWSFYYRASNNARFASGYPKVFWFDHEPGLDRTEIERPRTEWVFQCPYGDLQWAEPDAAKDLWRKRCAQIHFDVVALNGDGTSWERRRNGELAPLLGDGFATKFPGRQDLEPIPEGVR